MYFEAHRQSLCFVGYLQIVINDPNPKFDRLIRLILNHFLPKPSKQRSPSLYAEEYPPHHAQSPLHQHHPLYGAAGDIYALW